MYFCQLLFQRPFAAGGIAVDTRNGHTREQRRERLLKLFGAQPYGYQVRGTAGRALARHRTLTVTVVAAQMVLRLLAVILNEKLFKRTIAKERVKSFSLSKH